MKVAALCAAAALIWIVAGSRVQNHEKLALSAVVPGAVMTQPFGCTTLDLEPIDPLCPGGHVHTGIDLAAPEGTIVHAAMGGTARSGFDRSGAGLYVVVTSDQHVRALYCHLSAAFVAEGEAVTAGHAIGAIGATGMATGAHLHFEVQVDRRSVDPAVWLGP
ncbi:MAG TPA: M23 family metallopeptidase [Candidatus Dormibacteraeota bacterium]|nr:M23 family metallopeptidase [Candidatus Dormibacteraeota bacterium]